VPGRCAGVDGAGILSSLPLPDLSRCDADGVQAYFDNSWTLTEVLFASLQGPEAFYRPPYHGLRHPMIFYYGHPAALYVNKLRLAGLLKDPIHKGYEQIFETGVDEMSWDDMSKNDMEWPTVTEVLEYRREVYARVREIITEGNLFREPTRPITPESPSWALFMGFEHERIHLETSSVLIRELPIHLVCPPEAWPHLHPSALGERPGADPVPGVDYPRNPFRAVPAGDVTIGKPDDFPSYGWDSEYGQSRRKVRPFRATECGISNGEFYEFVRAGGYRDREFWSAEGWQWRRFRNVKWPTFWVPDGPANLHRYRLRTCFEVIDMSWSWPVEVNYHEARAYCAWRTRRDPSALPYRLPTEAEHHRLRDPAALDGNLNLAFGSPSPVDAFEPNSAGFRDVFGNVWQWLEDHFHPLDGFRVHPFYDDFSTPCFDGKHQMMLGGSFISTGDEACIWARSHFRPHFHQHAGLRLVVNEDGDPTLDAVHLSRDGERADAYESRRAGDEYLGLHYGSAEDNMPFPFGPVDALDFPVRCARFVIDAADALGIRTERALDLGCGVGRAAFELARRFDSVVGIDRSEGFVELARQLRATGSAEYRIRIEGEIYGARTAHVPADIDRDRVTFSVGDACALPEDLGPFDAVLLGNLLCRLPRPGACLERLAGPQALVRPGGIVALLSPYTWMPEFTRESEWLGGVMRDPPTYTRDAILERLSADFVLRQEGDFPLLIREHFRKYQYVVSHGMLLQRVSG
jgi:5-histidylcysteine sulfoxide synthase/putative 4-mercaptohistidine N1-methyltranferase